MSGQNSTGQGGFRPAAGGPTGAQLAAGALAGLLPPLFLEARVQGGNLGEQLITQLGLSMPAAKNLDVAIFTRTSGTAFAVGIGSFVAYKLLHRLIRSNCLWDALEQISPEQETASTATAPESPVELTEGFYAVRLGGENELLKRLDECLSDKGSPTARQNRVSVVQVRQASALKQLYHRNHRIRRAGIAALDHCSSGEEEPLDETTNRRDILVRYGAQRRRSSTWGREDDEHSLSGLSDLTSASRIAPNPRHCTASPHPPALPEQFPECDTPPGSSSGRNSCSTRKSASLHLNYDNELCWENEFSTNSTCTDVEEDAFDDDEGLFLFRERGGSLGGLSQLSAMKNLERMFNQQDWHENADDRPESRGEHLLENALEDLRGMNMLDVKASTSSVFNLVKAKQQEQEEAMTESDKTDDMAKGQTNFPFTAYRIVVQNSDFERSEISSLHDSNSPLHRPNQRPESSTSQGLWELTLSSGNATTGTYSRAQFEKPCPVIGTAGKPMARGQVEGGIAGLLGPGAMFDSVISSHSSFASTSAQSRSRVGTGQPVTTSTGGIMYDSAIVTDFQSSGDDDDCREHGMLEKSVADEMEPSPRSKGGIYRRYGDIEDRPLSKISEQSTPVKRVCTPSAANAARPPSMQGSEPSLEWF